MAAFTIRGSVCGCLPALGPTLPPVMLPGLRLGSVAVLLLKGVDQLSLHPSPHLETAKQIRQPSAAH